MSGIKSVGPGSNGSFPEFRHRHPDMPGMRGKPEAEGEKDDKKAKEPTKDTRRRVKELGLGDHIDETA